MCSHTACVYIQFSWPSTLNVVDLSAKRAINTPYQARMDGLLFLESRPSERLCYLVIISCPLPPPPHFDSKQMVLNLIKSTFLVFL